MNIDETNTQEAIKEYYSELESSLYRLADRRPDLINEIAKELKCLLIEKYQALEGL